MLASMPLENDLWQDVVQICRTRGVKWLEAKSGIGKSKIYRLLSDPTDECVRPVHDHLRWAVKQEWDRNPHPPGLPKCHKDPGGWHPTESGGRHCPACAPVRASSHQDIRLPVGPPSRELIGAELRELHRQADELKGKWEIDAALMLTQFAFDRRRATCQRHADATDLLRIATKVAELSRRSGDPERHRDSYDRCVLPAVRVLATFARDEDARLSLAAAMNAVKELVAAESESFSKPVREPWARRVEWLSNVATRHAARLAAADSDGFNSVGRQLALAAIRRLSRPDRPAVPSPGQKIWATMPLHYFGLRNLQAIEFFERGQTAAIVDTLAEDYAAARQTIFAPDGSLVANEGERSTMMGMALYLGIARSKTRQ